MTAADYLEQTKKAIQQLFSALAFYKNLSRQAVGPTFVGWYADEEDRDAQLQRWLVEKKPEIERAREKSREYFGIYESQNVISGGILQVAFMGIQLFSPNSGIPKSCAKFVKPDTKAVKFCIGREVLGLPLGLVIYAGRNQHYHADEEKLHPINLAVFDHLANYESKGKYQNPAFVPSKDFSSLANNVLFILAWRDYEAYVRDMQELLNLN